MRKVAESKLNIQNREAMKVMEQKIKQLKDELDLKVDLVKKIKNSPATSTNAKKTAQKLEFDSSVFEATKAKKEDTLDTSSKFKDLDVKKVESKRIYAGAEESSDHSLINDEVSTSATKKGFLPQIENRIVPNVKNNGAAAGGSKKLKVRSVSANVRESQNLDTSGDINEKSNILDCSSGEVIPDRKKGGQLTDSNLADEGKSRRVKADFIILADKHKNLLEKYEALMEKLVKERKKFEETKLALVKQHEKENLELRRINNEFVKEIAELKKEYEFQTSMNTQRGDEKHILYKKIVSLERVNGVMAKENDELRKKNENMETKIKRLETDILTNRTLPRVLNPVEGKSLSPEGRAVINKREAKSEKEPVSSQHQQIHKYKLAPIKRKAPEGDKAEVDKKKRESFLDQYESIIFELIRFTDKKILEGLKQKYPALESFIHSINNSGLQNPGRPKEAVKKDPNEKKCEFNDLDSNFNSHEEDLALYPDAGLDSNPEDN